MPQRQTDGLLNAPIIKNFDSVQRLLLTLGLLWRLFLPADGQMPFFRSHPLPEEHQDAEVNLVWEAGNGYIWVGTSKGAFRYDGVDYQYLAVDSLSGGAVSALFEDRDGTVWIGFAKGHIYRLDPTGSLQRWQPEEGTPAAAITGFAEDGQGRIWFSTYGEGLYYLDQDHLYNLNIDDGLLGDDVYVMKPDAHGRMWCGTDGGISICWVEEGEKKLERLTKAEGLPDEIVRELLPQGERYMWIGMYDRGVCRYDLEEQTFDVLQDPWEFGVVNALELFEDHEIWIGTNGQGIWRYAFTAQTFQPLELPNHPSNTKILDLHVDVEGNVWAVSRTRGLFSANRQFELLAAASGSVQAVLEDSRHRLWIGTPGGLFRYDRSSSENWRFVEEWGSYDLNVVCLQEDEYGHIWAGTFGQGVFCFDPATGRRRQITPADGLANENVLSIDGINNKMWLATLGGVTELEFNDRFLDGGPLKYRNFDRESDLGTGFVYKIFVDSRGRTWIGTDGKGLSVIDNGRITSYSMADTVPLKTVYSITEDWLGHIWLSTDRNGIFEFDGERFSHLTVKEGIRDLSIFSLATDAKGNILIVHPSGVDLLDPLTRHLIYYDEEVGIQDIYPNLNAICESSEGDIWIGTQQALLRFTSLKENLEIHPRTQINSVSVFLEPIDFRRVSDFSHRQNSLVFDYVGLWYTDPSTVKYRYMLDGYDQRWIYSRDRLATYSNVPPGSYVFRVTSTENEAFDQEPIVEYAFTIHKPFWLQWWFILLCTAFGFSQVYLFLKLRDERMQREALLKKEKIESQFEALKSQINPHFLFNSFNTLIAMIEEEPQHAVRFVEKLSDFYRSIIQYREKEVISVEEEIELVRNFVYLLENRYGENLQLELALNGQGGYVAPLTLQMLVENAVKHNVISKSRPLQIQIAIDEQGYITVANNLQKKLTPAPSTGFGIQSIINRYALLTDKKVRIEESDRQFKVSVPLIKNDHP